MLFLIKTEQSLNKHIHTYTLGFKIILKQFFQFLNSLKQKIFGKIFKLFLKTFFFFNVYECKVIHNI